MQSLKSSYPNNASNATDMVSSTMISQNTQNKSKFFGNKNASSSLLQSVKPRSPQLRLETELKLNTALLKTSGAHSGTLEFYCELCQVQSTNLSAYYDHLNSKRHQKAAGYTLKVPRSTLPQVLAKLEELKKEHAKICSQLQKGSEHHHKYVSYSERLEREAFFRREERKKKKLVKEDILEHQPIPIDKDMINAGFTFAAFGSSKSQH